MLVLVVVGVPIGAALVAGLVLQFFTSTWLLRIFHASVAMQLGLVPFAWLVMVTAPDRENWTTRSGGTCPDYVDSVHGHALTAMSFGSIALGGAALASAALSAHRGVAGFGRIILGLCASALPFAIIVPLVLTSLCGLD